MRSSFIPLVALFSQSCWATFQPSSPISVKISAGTVQGASCPNANANAFLAIPYAEPPVGNLRFASPQAYGSYPSGTYNATVLAPACIQFGTTFLESGPSAEDCLYLDVWVPSNATSASGLPVKVWIYGGGENAGGISNPLYNGCNLAKDDAIVVSINYRLGPLGFLALKSAGIDGNFGIQDILLGLEWIQSNIAAFGGDPKKVLLFGQSAGATNAFIISTLPNATSLISAAISESGGGRDVATDSISQALGASYAATLNCSVTDIACFRSISVSEMNKTDPTIPGTTIYSSLNPNTFQPYIDGKVIPVQPSAVGTKVPTIYGSNSMEGNLFVLGQFGLPTTITAATYSSFLQTNFGPASSLVASTYPLSLFNKSSPFPAFSAMATIITDVSYFCPAHRALKLAAQNGVPAWTYLWNHTPSCSWFEFIPQQDLPFFGPTHTAEIPFVFGNLAGLPLLNGTCNLTTAEHGISDTLVAAWTSMAATGNPSGAGSSFNWPPYNASASLGIVVDNATEVAVVNYTVCEFWDQLDVEVLNFTVNSTSSTTSTTSSSTPSSMSASIPSSTSTSTPSLTPSSTHSSGARGIAQSLIGDEALILAILGALTMAL